MVRPNGTKQTSNAMLRWAQERGVAWHHLKRGSPMRNALIEGINSRERHECLTERVFASHAEAIGVIGPRALMEDCDPVRRMERAGPTLNLAMLALTTSTHRFAGRGPAAIIAGSLRLYALYALGASSERLAWHRHARRRRKAFPWSRPCGGR
jgi:transposase InsO family protein